MEIEVSNGGGTSITCKITKDGRTMNLDMSKVEEILSEYNSQQLEEMQRLLGINPVEDTDLMYECVVRDQLERNIMKNKHTARS